MSAVAESESTLTYADELRAQLRDTGRYDYTLHGRYSSAEQAVEAVVQTVNERGVRYLLDWFGTVEDALRAEMGAQAVAKLKALADTEDDAELLRLVNSYVVMQGTDFGVEGGRDVTSGKYTSTLIAAAVMQVRNEARKSLLHSVEYAFNSFLTKRLAGLIVAAREARSVRQALGEKQYRARSEAKKAEYETAIDAAATVMRAERDALREEAMKLGAETKLPAFYSDVQETLVDRFMETYAR